MNNIGKKISIYEVAKKEVSDLSEKDKAFLLDHPDYDENHFGYGMYLRNKYIHTGILEEKDESGFVMHYMPDDLSEILFNIIINKLKEQE